MGSWHQISNWYGDFSCSVARNQIHQGVRQGAIPSTSFTLLMSSSQSPDLRRK